MLYRDACQSYLNGLPLVQLHLFLANPLSAMRLADFALKCQTTLFNALLLFADRPIFFPRLVNVLEAHALRISHAL